MNLSKTNEDMDKFAEELKGVKGLKQRLGKRDRFVENLKKERDTNKQSELMRDLDALKNELKVGVDLVSLLGQENVEFLEEGNDRKPDLRVYFQERSIFIEVATIREDIKEKEEFLKTLISHGSAYVRDYFEKKPNKLWDIYQEKTSQLKGPYNILVIMSERHDLDIDTIMKYLFGTSFEGTTLEDAIDKIFEAKIDPIYNDLSKVPGFGFNNKEDWIKETIKMNIKGLILRLFEGFFSDAKRDLVAVAFNGIREGTFFINPFSKLDFDIKKLFSCKAI